MTERQKSPIRMPALTLSAIAFAAALICSPAAVIAQDAAAPAAAAPTAAAPAAPKVDPKTVLATVGDRQITEGDLEIAGSEMAQDMQQQQVPQEFQRAYVLEGLINLDLVAQAAKDAKIDQGDDYKQLLSYFSDRALQRVFLLKTVVPQMSGDALKKAYDDYVKAFQPQDELHARHILVKTQAEAQDIKKQLDGGAKFEDIAKAKSIDTGSGANGGDLGTFARGQMVKPFEDAAFALKVGQVSDPVQSQFGWHIIRVDAIEKTKPQTLEQVSQQLQQDLFTKGLNAALADVKQKNKVAVTDPALDAQVKQMTSGGDPTAAAPPASP
jgi:peptidyl-prolyl cis-trans isomerase C